MRTRPSHHRAATPLFTTVLAAALLTVCAAAPPSLPVTEHSRPFQAMNERMQGTAPPVAQTVTYERLRRARSEPDNWLTYYGAYDGQRFSPLSQINTRNVAPLKVAWVFQYTPVGLIAGPANFAFEAAPIIVDGVMFVSGPDAHVWALDAVTGAMLWHYHHAVPLDTPLCCGNANRGVAVAGGKVFFVTPNGHLIALDATTGRPAWDRTFADVRAGESAAAARRGSPAPTIPSSASSTGPPATLGRISTGRRTPGAISSPTASWRSIRTPVPSAGTTKRRRTTSGTMTGSARTSCSNRAGASCSPISTRTAICSFSTAPTGSSCACGASRVSIGATSTRRPAG